LTLKKPPNAVLVVGRSLGEIMDAVPERLPPAVEADGDGPANGSSNMNDGRETERMRSFIDAATDWFWETDLDGRLTFISEGFFAATGFKPGEVIGMNRSDVGFQGVDPKIDAAIARAFARREPYRNHVSYADMPNGRRIWVRASAIPYFDEAGQPVGYRGVSTDVTDEYKAREALRRSERRFADFAEVSSDWYWETDASLRFTYMSPRFFSLSGLRPSDVIGKTREEFGFAVQEVAGYQSWRQAVEARQPYRSIDVLGVTSDGRRLWVRTGGTPVFDADGEFIGYRGASSDVSDHYLAEETLELNGRRFELFAEAASDWFWEVGPDLRFTYVSGRVEAFTGMPASWYVGKTWPEVAGDAGASPRWSTYRTVLDRREPFRNFRFPRYGTDGERQWLSVSGRPSFDGEGIFQGYLGVATDVTTQVADEARLREFEAIVRAADHAIVTSSPTGEIVSWNPGAERLYGYTAGEALGQHISIITPNEQRFEQQADFRQSLLETPGTAYFEVPRLRKDGGIVEVGLTLSSMVDDQGKVTGLAAIAQDISIRKSMEQALRDHAERTRVVLDTIVDGIITLDDTGSVQSANPAALALFGYRSDQLLGKDIRSLMTPEMGERFGAGMGRRLMRAAEKASGTMREGEGVRADGTRMPVEFIVSAFSFGGQRMFAVVLRDISGRKLAEEKLRELASLDPLTGVYNRRQFDDLARAEMERWRRYGSRPSLIMLDGDHFKAVNDRYGHQAGDDVLKRIAAICKDAVRQVDVVARMGGEEFAVLLPETDLAAAKLVAERIRAGAEAASVEWDDTAISFTLSLGLVQAQSRDEAIGDLIRLADQALYRAKHNGRNQVVAARTPSEQQATA
jgi:diguanylate cyclase (GGDEF)-like protein/PAS domain S-box-containing protein